MPHKIMTSLLISVCLLLVNSLPEVGFGRTIWRTPPLTVELPRSSLLLCFGGSLPCEWKRFCMHCLRIASSVIFGAVETWLLSRCLGMGSWLSGVMSHYCWVNLWVTHIEYGRFAQTWVTVLIILYACWQWALLQNLKQKDTTQFKNSVLYHHYSSGKWLQT
jgi:hypothetical protein